VPRTQLALLCRPRCLTWCCRVSASVEGLGKGWEREKGVTVDPKILRVLIMTRLDVQAPTLHDHTHPYACAASCTVSADHRRRLTSRQDSMHTEKILQKARFDADPSRSSYTPTRLGASPGVQATVAERNDVRSQLRKALTELEKVQAACHCHYHCHCHCHKCCASLPAFTCSLLRHTSCKSVVSRTRYTRSMNTALNPPLYSHPCTLAQRIRWKWLQVGGRLTLWRCATRI
jgi:hypothetical protein